MPLECYVSDVKRSEAGSSQGGSRAVPSGLYTEYLGRVDSCPAFLLFNL